MKFFFLLLTTSLFFLGCNAQTKNAQLLTPSDFKAKIAEKNIQLIDVRTPSEFAAGHISNAKNIDYLSADFKAQIAKLDKSKPVLVYCQVGGRSAKAVKMLSDAGFKLIFELKGGYSAYPK